MSDRPLTQPEPGLVLLEIYDAALPHVYGYLLYRCRERELAEDLTGETFLAAVGAVRRGIAPEPSTGWLIGIARHKLADHWRGQQREERGLRLVRGGISEEEDPWDAQLDAIRARDILGRLRPHHRVALVLRYLDGLPVPEVARHLGRTVHGTEALLVRARRAFRRAYEAEEGGVDD